MDLFDPYGVPVGGVLFWVKFSPPDTINRRDARYREDNFRQGVSLVCAR